MNARGHLQSLVGREIPTFTGRPNRVLEFRGDEVIVATSRSPQGQPVPIASVQDAMDELEAAGELAIEVEAVGYRSAFVGAVLLTVPGVERVPGATRRVRLSKST